jgi:hypothetical protein
MPVIEEIADIAVISAITAITRDPGDLSLTLT